MEIRQYLYISYTIDAKQEPFVIVQSVDAKLRTVQIPAWIENLPVRALAPYAMSSGEHEEICLPAGLDCIGRYAFYNCRNLHTFRFPSGIRDIGSGAFTGCHQVRYLDVEMEKDKPSCLKEILSELPEELQAELHGEEEAMLLFPEFYEEGVENTPARILMTQVHGSGIWYRNCFQGRRFCYGEYDRCFDKALALESVVFNIRLAMGRLRFPHELSEEAKESYLDFLKMHLLEALEYLMSRQDEEGFSWLLELCTPNQETFAKIQSSASQRGLPGINMLLSHYQRGHFLQGRRRRSL
ncbi:MAG: leucine-rich repeat domain-containing protein [Eubacteriales bacterium]|nr:leucine-rich repeat domain-containing protein [Eubacteriales bacterium]